MQTGSCMFGSWPYNNIRVFLERSKQTQANHDLWIPLSSHRWPNFHYSQQHMARLSLHLSPSLSISLHLSPSLSISLHLSPSLSISRHLSPSLSIPLSLCLSVSVSLSLSFPLSPSPARSRSRSLFHYWEGRYGLVDKTHPSCVRPGFTTRVQH